MESIANLNEDEETENNVGHVYVSNRAERVNNQFCLRISKFSRILTGLKAHKKPLMLQKIRVDKDNFASTSSLQEKISNTWSKNALRIWYSG